MAIEIGSLVVRGSFGHQRSTATGLSEEDLQEALSQLRREFRDDMVREIANSEQRIKEGMV